MKTKLLLAILLLSHVCEVCSQTAELSKKEKNAINEHGVTFMPFAVIASEDALEELRVKYRFNTEQASELYRILKIRETRKYAHNYIESDPKSRAIIKMEIDNIYQDSLNAILIPQNLNISGRCISMTLRLAKTIKLSNKKEKKLMDCALDYARRLKQNPYVNFAKEEMATLNKYLTKRQLEFVIDEKNKIQASVKAQQAWNALEKAGETEELDSLQQMIRANMYYTLEMRYHDLYVGENELLTHNLSDLYNSKPKIIKLYEALEERKRIKTKTSSKEKNVSSAFSW